MRTNDMSDIRAAAAWARSCGLVGEQAHCPGSPCAIELGDCCFQLSPASKLDVIFINFFKRLNSNEIVKHSIDFKARRKDYINLRTSEKVFK